MREWNGTGHHQLQWGARKSLVQHRKNMCRDLELCLDLLYCSATPLKSDFSLNIVWKGKLT